MNRKRWIVFISAFFLVVSSLNVLSVQQIISLQGKVDYQGELVSTGDVRVTIWDNATGGDSCLSSGVKDPLCTENCCMYNSTDNFDDNVVNGFFDIMLGSITALDLNYNQYYWLDIEVNHSDAVGWFDIDWNGNERKQFESVSGDVFSNDIDIKNGSLFVCEDGCGNVVPAKIDHDSSYEGDVYIEGSEEIQEYLFVREGFTVNNDNASSTPPIYNIIGNDTVGTREPNAINYMDALNDLYVEGELAVGGTLFAENLVMGTTRIDTDSHEAFIVQPKGNASAWVFRVDTIDREVEVNGTLVFPDGTEMTSATGLGFFYNNTPATYTPDFSRDGYTGYPAGNAICNDTFPGTHMCAQSEVINTMYIKDISTLAEWTGNAWVHTGGPKFAPAANPVNDCKGWTIGSAGNYLGSFWIFDNTNGGYGGAVNCGESKSLACCVQ